MKAREREGGSGIADGLPAKWAKQQVIRLFVRVIGVEEDEGGGERSMVWGKMNEQRWRHRNCEANEAVTKWRKLRSEMTPASPRASQHAYHVEESNGFGRASFLSISAHTHNLRKPFPHLFPWRNLLCLWCHCETRSEKKCHISSIADARYSLYRVIYL